MQKTITDYHDGTAPSNDESPKNVPLQESIGKAPKKADRIAGQKYIYKEEVRIWTGKVWHCEHNRQKTCCKDCGGTSICEHNIRRRICKECEGEGICEHNRQRSICKECRGSSICPHGRQRFTCKECGGVSICPHDRIRSICKESFQYIWDEEESCWKIRIF